MEEIVENVHQNAGLVVAVAVTSALGTILFRKLFGGDGRKYATGKGPTGRGKWTLYHCLTSPSSRCLWLIEEMKALDDFEIEEYDPETATPEEVSDYKKDVNPLGSVPALVTSEGDVLTDSAAICLHLAHLYGQCLPDGDHQANYFSWAVAGTTTADRCVSVLYKQMYEVEEKDRNPETIKSSTVACLQWIENLEKLLSDKRKFLCNRFTAVDVILGYSVFYASLIKGGMLFRDSPHVQDYLQRLKARPLWNQSMGTARDWMTTSR